MISLNRLRELEPKLKDASDEEVAKIRDQLYELAQLTFDSHMAEDVSKIPVGLKKIDVEK